MPYPVNYGGVFDLFYKLGALQASGVNIHLHCFEYGRGEQNELNKYCSSVHYYKRTMGFQAFSIKIPYIVSSRSNKELMKRLAQDEHPILMEGIHCTWLLNDARFKHRRCFVRLHNVEHVYYNYLFQHSTQPFKKMYYSWESNQLKCYEKSIVNKATYWSVIETDTTLFRSMGCNDITFLPLFLPPWKVSGREGKGTFCLYHGDLSVPENEKAAHWLLDEVFHDLEIPFVVAGKDPSASLVHKAENTRHTCIVANPGENEMQDMVAKAHIHILPSFNATGIKVKLVNALFNGRHCVANPSTVDGTGLETACIVAHDTADFRQIISKMYQQPFTETELLARKQLLTGMFDNEANARQMVKWIWGK